MTALTELPKFLFLKDARKPSQPSTGNTESFCNSLGLFSLQICPGQIGRFSLSIVRSLTLVRDLGLILIVTFKTYPHPTVYSLSNCSPDLSDDKKICSIPDRSAVYM